MLRRGTVSRLHPHVLAPWVERACFVATSIGRCEPLAVDPLHGSHEKALEVGISKQLENGVDKLFLAKGLGVTDLGIRDPDHVSTDLVGSALNVSPAQVRRAKRVVEADKDLPAEERLSPRIRRMICWREILMFRREPTPTANVRRKS